MKIAELFTTEDFESVLELQREIWGFKDIDILPTHLFRAFCEPKNPDGVLLGAFDGSNLIGFLFCLPTSEQKILLMHMIGILPKSQKRGVGTELMLKLKSISEARGIRKIVWTYDPLESVNANLYFHKLGAICRQYLEDYYTMHESKTHSGFPADRFKMEMYIDAQLRAKSLIGIDDSDIFEVEIPANFQDLKNQNIDFALTARKKTRHFFAKINSENYIVTDFIYAPGMQTGKYILKKNNLSITAA